MATLYADFEIKSSNNDMFVVTPEGNYFCFFSSMGYDENHAPIEIEDPESHEKYTVVFDK